MNKRQVVEEVLRILQVTDQRFKQKAEKLYDRFTKQQEFKNSHVDSYLAMDLAYKIADNIFP